MSRGLTDSVAAEIMGEIHKLTQDIEAQQARVEGLANTVIAAAQSVKSDRKLINNENEQFLVRKVEEIKTAILDIKSVESGIQQAAVKQTEKIISPLVSEMSDHVKKLTSTDTDSRKFLKAALDVQQSMTKNVVIYMLVYAIGMLLAFMAGFLWHK